MEHGDLRDHPSPGRDLLTLFFVVFGGVAVIGGLATLIDTGPLFAVGWLVLTGALAAGLWFTLTRCDTS